jgi:hypothetical protein
MRSWRDERERLARLHEAPAAIKTGSARCIPFHVTELVAHRSVAGVLGSHRPALGAQPTGGHPLADYEVTRSPRPWGDQAGEICRLLPLLLP